MCVKTERLLATWLTKTRKLRELTKLLLKEKDKERTKWTTPPPVLRGPSTRC